MNRKTNFIEWMHKIGNVYQGDYLIDRGLWKVDDVYAPVLPPGVKQNTYVTQETTSRRHAKVSKNSKR